MFDVDVEMFDVDEVVAPDFRTFLDQLRVPESADVLGLITGDRIESIASRLSAAAGFVFEDQGDQDHGYRIFRARLPGEASWAWLEENRVTRGFVRTSEADCAQLRKRFSELVDRYPKHSDLRARSSR